MYASPGIPIEDIVIWKMCVNLSKIHEPYKKIIFFNTSKTT